MLRCLLVALLSGCCDRTFAKLQEVTSLPGLATKPCFRHYSGYAVGASSQKQLFFWIVDAIESPEKKPVVLWLNGGPGCSSVMGMWGEVGPFVVGADGIVTLNPYSWNKAANMIFIEQPVGVGFSYPAVNTSDVPTTADTYHALLQILKDYRLAGRPFYILGESYGGHYVPNTVLAIVNGNAAVGPNHPDYIDIKGFGVGNGYTDWQLDFNANVAYGRYHGLCSRQQFDHANRVCNGFFAACFWKRPGTSASNTPMFCEPACEKAVEVATKNALGGSIDIYDIYMDVCKEDQERVPTQEFTLLAHRHKSAIEASVQPGNEGGGLISPIFPICTDNYVGRYLSRADVQEAIHAKRIKTWNGCGLLNKGEFEIKDNGPMNVAGGANYEFNFESHVPTYSKWIKEGKLDILIYSGDTDFIVNFMGTENWLEALNVPARKQFVPWMGSDRQVAGYLTEYTDKFRFATVKGAGHMVPRDRPRHALDLFTAFLEGHPIDGIKPSEDGPLCSKPPQDEGLTRLYM